MTIAFQCECGKGYAVGDEFANRRTKCKECGAALTVPAAAASDDFEVVEESAPAADPVRKRRKKPKYKGMTRDEERDTVERMNATMDRQVRFTRSVVLFVGGLVYLVGLAVTLLVLSDQPVLFAFVMSGCVGFVMMGLGVVAAGAVAKGALGLYNSYQENS